MASISRPTAGQRTETENTGTSMLLLEIVASRWLSRMASISRPTASHYEEQLVPGQLQATGAASRSTDSPHCGRRPAAPGLAQCSECARGPEWGSLKDCALRGRRPGRASPSGHRAPSATLPADWGADSPAAGCLSPGRGVPALASTHLTRHPNGRIFRVNESSLSTAMCYRNVLSA